MKPLILVALICGYDADTDRYTRDCAPYEEAAASVADCRAMAAWLRASSPAGVRVIASECFRADERRPAVARR